MRDLYALEAPDSKVNVGIDLPFGGGTLSMTVRQGVHGPVVDIHTSGITGAVEVRVDGLMPLGRIA